ncbi:MAG: hypothetical protein GWO07_13640 [Candidatus Dadabacteria bacterium]|nr:hypothetical protein [Candidatus Dadabacteria bacterium]NIS09767.1 hypothetical protein [Candidatus Dadabacteria bacterium]NIY22535.1 hypothetical protein [Candidatus Dadabacteria bacterium]
MANSVLVVYEPLNEVIEKKDYWKKYIDFYEKYWDGPSSFQSVWFGKEFDDFRDALSDHLGMDKEFIEDCFFIKDQDEKYYISPLSENANPYVFSSENYIPPEWFMLFSADDKKLTYTHTGYGAISQDGIYYNTGIKKAAVSIEKAHLIIKNANERSSEAGASIIGILSQLHEGVDNIKSWLENFNQNGKVVLSYGDICTYIPNYSLNGENSVQDIWDILDLIENGNYEEVESRLNIFIVKWKETFSQASEQGNKSTVQ